MSYKKYTCPFALLDGLAAESDTDAALDMIFLSMSDWLMDSNFEACDDVLNAINVDETQDAVLVGLIINTYWARKLLKNRPGFIKRTSAALAKRGASEVGISNIMRGLE